MYFKNYLKISLALILITFTGFSSIAQSWSFSTILQNNDTVADLSTACTVDNSGNSYWASHYYVNNTTKSGYWIWKVDKTGGNITKRVITLNTSALIIEQAIDMKVFGGSLYLIFNVKKATTPFDRDLCTQKYDLNLSKLWESIYATPNNGTEEKGGMIAEGPFSGLLVTLTSGTDARVLNYAKNNGQLLNSLVYNNGNGNTETINKIVYGAGSIYIGGKNELTASAKVDMFIARYDSNFVPKWNKIFDVSVGSGFDELKDMSIDANNDVVVTGNFTNSTGPNRVFFTKYNDTNGSRLWLRKLTNDFIQATNVFTNTSNNLVSVVSGEPCRFVSVNNSTGAILASKGIFNAANINLTVSKIVKGSTNELYIIGNYDSTYTSGGVTTTLKGAIVSKIDAAGGRTWDTKTLSPLITQNYTAGDICIKSSSRIFYAVNIFDPLSAPKKTYCYYNSIGTANGLRLGEEENVSNTDISVYPNPASGNVNMIIRNATEASATLRIFSIDGKAVSSSVIQLTEGEQNILLPIEGLKTGIYLIQVQQDAKIWKEKLLVQ